LEREATFTKLQQDNAHLQAQLKALNDENAQLKEAQGSYSALLEEIEELQTKNEALEAKLKDSKNIRDKQWEDKLEQLGQEKHALVEEHTRTLEKMERENAERLAMLRNQLQSYRELAQFNMEEKDKELSRANERIKALEKDIDTYKETLAKMTQQLQRSNTSKALQEIPTSTNPVVETTSNSEKPQQQQQQQQQQTFLAATPKQDLLLLSHVQAATREEEVNRYRQRIQQLLDDLREAEEMAKLHRMQETVLKEQIRELERGKLREGANLEYLKNIILKLLETNEQESLLPVLSTLLQFTPQEKERIAAARSRSLWTSLWRA
jgi:hypothetical protein